MDFWLSNPYSGNLLLVCTGSGDADDISTSVTGARCHERSYCLIDVDNDYGGVDGDDDNDSDTV